MTDKEMAEASWRKEDLWYKVNADESSYTKGFLSGLKAGKKEIKKESKQLVKAKEIIKKLISDNRKVWIYSDVREEAEEFLKEVKEND